MNAYKDILLTLLIYLFTIFINIVNVLKSKLYNQVPLQKRGTP